MIEDFADREFLNLVTVDANDQAFSSCSWFVVLENRLYVGVPGNSAKVGRVETEPRVTATPCDASGKLLGPVRDGQARLVKDESLERRALEKLGRKYGFRKKMRDTVRRIFARPTEVVLEIELIDLSDLLVYPE